MATILIADDTSANREPMARLLRLEGYTVMCAQDGTAAVELLKSHPDVDVVLLDLMMPRMDGQSFLRWLRNEPKYSHLPVIVISGTPTGEAAQQVRRLGISAMLRKAEFSFRELLERIAGCLPHATAATIAAALLAAQQFHQLLGQQLYL